MRRVATVVITALTVLFVGYAANGAEWGDLTGTFIYDGKPPKSQFFEVTQDKPFCGKHKILDENLVVNRNGGIRDVIIHLYIGRSGSQPPPIHPDYAKTAKARVKLDNAKCRFEPHVVTLRTTQTLIVSNSDLIGHNTNIGTINNPGQNILVPAGDTIPFNFRAAERFPVKVTCNIHPWMNGKVLIQDHPYMTVSDANGKFTIKNLPVGTWKFQFRHEKYITDAKLRGRTVYWRRGRVDLTIKQGDNDLGEIKLPPKVF